MMESDKHQPDALVMPVKQSFVTTIPQEKRLSIKGRQTLVFKPGIWKFELLYQSFVDPSGKSEADGISMEIHTGDSNGERWKIIFYTEAYDLLSFILGLEGYVERKYLNRCPESWNDAFKENCIGRNLKARNDCRENIWLTIQSDDYSLYTRHFGLAFDLALLPVLESTELFVLIRSPGFVSREGKKIKPFVTKVDFGKLLVSEDEVDLYSPDGTKCYQSPSVEKLEGRAEPQPIQIVEECS